MYIGIDLGGTNIAAGVVDERGNIIAKSSVPTRRERDYTEIVKDMASLTKKITADAGKKLSDIKSVGIGSPGTVDTRKGTVVHVNNLHMDNAPVAKEFQKYIDVPVNMENDANAAAYGEYITGEDKPQSLLLMTLGTGVGGGIVIDGKIYRGFNGAGAEMGHTVLVCGGVECSCGRRGCLESYASVTALIRQTKEMIEKHPESIMSQWEQKRGKISGRTAFECARKGDRAATEVRDRYIEYVAEGVTNLINIFQPQVFVIGGGISREGDNLLLPIKKFVEKHDYNRYMPKTEIRIAHLFNDAGIIGAALAGDTK